MPEQHPPAVDEVLYEALDRPPEERRRYVAEVCAGRPELRSEVESLLEVADQARGFLEGATLDSTEAAGAGLSVLRTGDRLGAYRLIRLLGTGGMGSVYLGERADGEFRKQVAVKLVRPGLDLDEVLNRFRTERQALAGLEHPNIARLLDGGTEEGLTGAPGDKGRPFLVMEYVDGEPIDRYCDRRQLSLHERLKLFLEVCGAVQHAHRNLIVHRDLKPGNILVDGDGVVKLLDFGIAKILSGEGAEPLTHTTIGFRAMTPAYASPEQFTNERVTTASDIYSLGVVLYELLSGELPSAADSGSSPTTAATTGRQLRRPSMSAEQSADSVAEARGERSAQRLARRLAGDLDNIVLQALRGEPERRYSTVEQFAADLRCYLAGLPVSARPDSFRYRATKFVRRNAKMVAGVAAGILILCAASVLSTTLYLRADRAQRLAEQERGRAREVSSFLQRMLASADPAVARGRDVTVLRELLDTTGDEIDEIEDPQVNAELRLTLGRTYHAIGEYETAIEHVRSALEIRERLLPERDPAIFEAEHQLGRSLYEAGHYERARELLQRSLTKARTANLDVTRFLQLIDRLASVEEALPSRAKAAEDLYREAVELSTRELGVEHRATARAKANLAQYLLNHGGLEEAEALLRQILPTYRRLHEDCPQCLPSVLQNLAGVLRRRGEYADAEKLYREAIEILGTGWEDHPRMAVVLNNLATTLELQGELQAAESSFRRALDLRRRLLGEDHRDVGTSLNNLARLVRKRGRLDESIALFEQAAEIYGLSLGPDHEWVAIVLGNLAVAHEARGDFAAALATVDEHQRIGQQYWSKDHWRLAAMESIRGRCLSETGRVDEGRRLLESALANLERQLGSDHHLSREARDRLRSAVSPGPS